MSRPTVGIRSISGSDSGSSAPLPAVFSSPVRFDVVRKVHTDMAKNSRQAYAVGRRVGHEHSAESWGTGRAVSRIPRVGGGGTSRSGQGAYGNMCRGGRMFAPTKTFRRWHRRINKNLRRYAVASSLAASALPALVMGRGHKIEKVPEIPLVVANELQSLPKTKDAVALLAAVNAKADVDKAKDSKKVRPGKGKWRNRRYTNRKGPLIVFDKDEGGRQTFRNLTGVDTCVVSAMNLLQLAPGGHMGRFIIFSEAAFRRLDALFGVDNKKATERNYRLPRSVCTNTDVTRVINDNAVQSVCRPKRKNSNFRKVRRNPLKNKGEMARLNPAAVFFRQQARKKLLANLRK